MESNRNKSRPWRRIKDLFRRQVKRLSRRQKDRPQVNTNEPGPGEGVSDPHLYGARAVGQQTTPTGLGASQQSRPSNSQRHGDEASVTNLGTSAGIHQPASPAPGIPEDAAALDSQRMDVGQESHLRIPPASDETESRRSRFSENIDDDVQADTERDNAKNGADTKGKDALPTVIPSEAGGSTSPILNGSEIVQPAANPGNGLVPVEDAEVDYTIDTRPPVVHEQIRPHVHTIYEPRRTRSIHLHEHRTVIQPIIDPNPTILPTQHWLKDGETGEMMNISSELGQQLADSEQTTSMMTYQSKVVSPAEM